MSAWIEMVFDAAADGDLRETLDLARTPHGTVDNVLHVRSLRPNSMRGHTTLYRSILPIRCRPGFRKPPGPPSRSSMIANIR
jgi:hypothetical protein